MSTEQAEHERSTCTEARLCELTSKGYAVLLSIEGNFYNVSVTHPAHERRNFAGTSLAGTVRLAWSLVLEKQ